LEIVLPRRIRAAGYIVVSHDEGAVQALKPERVILLPDGDEDIWKNEYFDLVAID